MKNIFWILLILLVVGGFWWGWSRSVMDGTEVRVGSFSEGNPIDSQKQLPSSLAGEGMGLDPEPASMPFGEMTIPYLRGREYESELAELEVYQDGASYVSYLTSYDPDGLKINGLLTIPKGEKPENGWPSVVFVHGYIPPAQYQTTERYGDYVDYLARNGLVVFKIDLRGHGESDGEASGAYYSGDYVVDVLNARAALQGMENVDSDRVGLWGHSMAGNVVLRAMVARPEVRRGVVWAGAVFTYEDWAEYRLIDGSYRPPSVTSDRQRRRDQLFSEYGSFDANHEFWKLVPATNYLEDLLGGVQVHHAVDDGVVSVEYSRNLVRLFEQAGVEHEFYEYASGGHNLTGSSFGAAMGRSLEWLLR